MSEVICAYQDAVAGDVERRDGHVARFLGDGVLAYFGWPEAHEDAAEQAVRAGLAVGRSVAKVRTVEPALPVFDPCDDSAGAPAALARRRPYQNARAVAL